MDTEEDNSWGILAPFLLFACLVLLFVGLEWFLVVMAITLLGCLLISIIAYVWIRSRFTKPLPNVIGFFHPFADGGGGGERVLWAAVQSLQQQRPDLQIVIFSGLGADNSPQALARQAASRFNLVVSPSFRVVPLRSRDRLLPEHYPRLTMARQAAASVSVALEGLRVLVPSIWVDTTGWSFPYPLVRLTGARVVAYVHYPTISTDMLGRVRSRESTFNNDATVAASPAKSRLKLAYYQAFAALYGAVGACADVVMVNSSWTKRHVASLWWRRVEPLLVFPPCDTAGLQALPLDRRLKRPYVVSVAQFRPEKDHETQLKAFAIARSRALKSPDPTVAEAVLSARLQLVGGCRNAGDEARLEHLKRVAKDLGLLEDGSVEFHVNVSFDELKALLGNAIAGLHTMKDEHFGISVVEYMAAGVVPIANDSGGPKEDIVVAEPVGSTNGPDARGLPQRTGFLCHGIDSYADALTTVLTMGQLERLRMAGAARRRAATFSDERFRRDFLQAVGPILPPPQN